MGVSFVAKGTPGSGGGSSTSYNITYPGGITANDLIVWADFSNSGSGTSDPMDSAVTFTQIGSKNEVGGTGSGRVFYKIASGSESGTLQIDYAAGSWRGGNVWVFRGSATVSPLEAFDWEQQASATSLNDNGVTSTTAGMAVNLIMSNNGSLTLGAFTGMTGGTWSEPAAEDNVSLITLGLNTAAVSGAGTINGGTQTITSSNVMVAGFAIKQAAVAGGGYFNVTVSPTF